VQVKAFATKYLGALTRSRRGSCLADLKNYRSLGDEMSFTIYEPSGLMFIQWFNNIDAVIASMLANPNNTYHRNP
jgi:hypothetical protein